MSLFLFVNLGKSKGKKVEDEDDMAELAAWAS